MCKFEVEAVMGWVPKPLLKAELFWCVLITIRIFWIS
jgi:hypothetical protein